MRRAAGRALSGLPCLRVRDRRRVAVRIALLDPPGFTPPYDHSLAAALGEHGHDVHLFTAPDLHGSARAPDGYTRHETFLPLSSRLLRRWPRARVRRYVKGAEYPPSVWRTERALARLQPDVVHVQWLPSPRYDVRWLANVVGRYPTVFTAHDVFTRRPKSAEAWGAALGLVDRVVVHSDRAVEQLEEIGVAKRRLARILHPVFTDGAGAEPTGEPAGQTLLFFGLVREYKGLDVLLRALPEIVGRVPGARLVVAGEPLEPAEPLLALADELELNGAVEWRLHFVREQEMAELFAEAACAVLPVPRAATRPACSRWRSAMAARPSSRTSARSGRSCASTAPAWSSRPRIPTRSRPRASSSSRTRPAWPRPPPARGRRAGRSPGRRRPPSTSGCTRTLLAERK